MNQNNQVGKRGGNETNKQTKTTSPNRQNKEVFQYSVQLYSLMFLQDTGKSE